MAVCLLRAPALKVQQQNCELQDWEGDKNTSRMMTAMRTLCGQHETLNFLLNSFLQVFVHGPSKLGRVARKLRVECFLWVYLPDPAPILLPHRLI